MRLRTDTQRTNLIDIFCAGLRREELISLTFDALKQQLTKNGKMRDVLEVKNAKGRVIPIIRFLAERLHEWRDSVGGGLVALSLGMSKELGERLSAVGVFKIVREYGKQTNGDGLYHAKL
jgi:integrase